MSNRFELVASIDWERHVFENSDGTRVVIVDGRREDDTDVVLKGEADEGALKRGLTYRFYGRMITHPKYGEQFAFQSFVIETPAGQRAVVTYLQQCKGIGPHVAHSLWKEFGDKSVEVLRTEPFLAAGKIKGLSRATAESASEFLKLNFFVERSKMELMELLNKRRLPKKLVDKLIKDFGSAAAERVRRNPYLLMKYRGCGFLLVDRLYLDLGKPPGLLKRQALCCWHAIARQTYGDTWYPARLARDGIFENISGADAQPDRALELITRAGGLRQKVDPTSGTWLSDYRKADHEQDLAHYASELILNNSGNWPTVEGESFRDATPHQVNQLKLALRSDLAILQGSPGTGKTWLVARLIRRIVATGTPLAQVAVCAPTGKAAVRVGESLYGAGVNMPSTTIHSLLQVNSSDDGWSFTHDLENPLPHKFVIVDEASMIDVDLANSLFQAIGPGTSLLLVGDENQLPPVGHGAPLIDLTAAGAPCGKLTEVQRNSGQIVRCCASIRDRRRFVVSKSIDLPRDNLVHVESGDSDAQISVVIGLLGKIASGDTYDPIWDVQVICAVNKKSPLSRSVLNAKLQDLLNPHGEKQKGCPFRVGDKIINTKNGWFVSVMPESDPVNADGKVYVANGEQARVLEVEEHRIVARCFNPDRTIRIPRSKRNVEDEAPADGDTGASSAGGDGEVGDAGGEQSTGSSWDLAYAISCHKSQGAEWSVVIVMADEHNGARMVQTRNWIFTAISRAKSWCVTVGKMTVIEGMLQRDGARRKTFLQELVREKLDRERNRIAIVAKDWTDDDFAGLLKGVL